jgi:hypothetical protein
MVGHFCPSPGITVVVAGIDGREHIVQPGTFASYIITIKGLDRVPEGRSLDQQLIIQRFIHQRSQFGTLFREEQSEHVFCFDLGSFLIFIG